LQALQRESREADIETEKGTSAKLLEEAKKAPRPEGREAADRGDKDAPHPLFKTQPVLELLAKRDDLKGLPVRKGGECQAGRKEAQALQEQSLDMRRSVGRLSRSNESVSYYEEMRRDTALIGYLDRLGSRAAGREETVVRSLTQMFQAENAPVRL